MISSVIDLSLYKYPELPTSSTFPGSQNGLSVSGWKGVWCRNWKAWRYSRNSFRCSSRWNSVTTWLLWLESIWIVGHIHFIWFANPADVSEGRNSMMKLNRSWVTVHLLKKWGIPPGTCMVSFSVTTRLTGYYMGPSSAPTTPRRLG